MTMTRPKKPRPRSGKHLHGGVLVRAPELEREAWARAAKRERLPRVEWMRKVLNAAAAGVVVIPAARTALVVRKAKP